MNKKKKQYYFVSHYSEYPLYTPEEGGYYYAGVELYKSFRFSSLKKAKKFLNKYAADNEMNLINDNKAVSYSRYKFSDEFIRIETVMGIHEQGQMSYC